MQFPINQIMLNTLYSPYDYSHVVDIRKRLTTVDDSLLISSLTWRLVMTLGHSATKIDQLVSHIETDCLLSRQILHLAALPFYQPKQSVRSLNEVVKQVFGYELGISIALSLTLC